LKLSTARGALQSPGNYSTLIDRIVNAAETGMRTQLQERAAQEVARRQELASRPRQRQGPSMGM